MISINPFPMHDSLIDGLIGYWPFSGNANDQSGGGNNGVVSRATLTSDKNGVSNSAYNFLPSNNEYITIGDVLDIGTGNFAISVWFYPNGTQGNPAGIVSKSLLGSAYGRYGIWMEGNSLFWMVSNATTTYGFSYALPANNVWYHAVVNINRSGNIECFLNTVNVGTNISLAPLVGENLQSTIPLRFGSYNNSIGGAGNYFNGKIDNVRIYNRILNSSEILTIYNGYL